MAKKPTQKIVTANDLILGDVIYFRADDTWTRDLQQAQVVEADAADARLAIAASQRAIAVGAYVTDIAVENGAIRTTHFREEFRKTGPSNYFHGKQAEQNHV